MKSSPKKREPVDKMSKKEICPWCIHNTHGCNPDDCDFRSLDLRKDAIYERIKTETVRIATLKQRIANEDLDRYVLAEIVSEIMDRGKGIQIMADVLIYDFQVPDAEVKRLIKDNAGERLNTLKLMYRLKRGGL